KPMLVAIFLTIVVRTAETANEPIDKTIANWVSATILTAPLIAFLLY
ncbi:unnamed protein product, partial [marine sediment metagenome]